MMPLFHTYLYGLSMQTDDISLIFSEKLKKELLITNNNTYNKIKIKI